MLWCDRPPADDDSALAPQHQEVGTSKTSAHLREANVGCDQGDCDVHVLPGNRELHHLGHEGRHCLPDEHLHQRALQRGQWHLQVILGQWMIVVTIFICILQ